MTDDYAAYTSLCSQHQLCWAHLIRTAIKRALQNPDERGYTEFLDQLCSIYDDAKQLRDARQAQAIADPALKQASVGQAEEAVQQVQAS